MDTPPTTAPDPVTGSADAWAETQACPGLGTDLGWAQVQVVIEQARTAVGRLRDLAAGPPGRNCRSAWPRWGSWR